MTSHITTDRPRSPGDNAAMLGPALRRQRLGRQLRLRREARSLRLQDVADHLGVAPSTLSRIESGKAPTRTSYLALMLDLYGIEDPTQRANLTDLAREGQRKGWWNGYNDLLSAEECNYLGLESAAFRMRSFSLQAVPDLLQTREYATAACRATRAGLRPGQTDRLVSAIQRRQQALFDGLRCLHFVVDESVLLRAIGSRDLMASQMRHLLDLTTYGTVTIQVLALASPQVVLSAPFTLLGFGDSADPEVAFGGGVGGAATMTKLTANVAALEIAFTALTRAAMSPTDSVKLISQLTEVTA